MQILCDCCRYSVIFANKHRGNLATFAKRLRNVARLARNLLWVFGGHFGICGYIVECLFFSRVSYPAISRLVKIVCVFKIYQILQMSTCTPTVENSTSTNRCEIVCVAYFRSFHVFELMQDTESRLVKVL